MKHSTRNKSSNSPRELTLAELGADLFGADNSPLPPGVSNVSGNIKALLKQKLLKKHRRSANTS